MPYSLFSVVLRRPVARLLVAALLGAHPARSQAPDFLNTTCYVMDWFAEGGAQPPLAAPAPVPLTVGQPVQGSATSEEAQTYTFRPAAGQVAHVVVGQQDLDAVVTALTPGGQPLAEVDNPKGSQGLEIIWLQAAPVGYYRVAVRPLEKNSVGTYQITLEAVRAATPADARRLRAQQLMAEGQTLRGAPLRTSSAAERQAAANKFAAAYASWHELKDAREADLAMLSLGRQ